jgi:hypothetical protein
MYLLAQELCNSLEKVSEECCVVLLFDDFHNLLRRNVDCAKWFTEYFLAQARKNERLVVTITSETHVADVGTWRETAELTEISKAEVDDILALAKKDGIKMNAEEAKQYLEVMSPKGDVGQVKLLLQILKIRQLSVSSGSGGDPSPLIQGLCTTIAGSLADVAPKTQPQGGGR